MFELARDFLHRTGRYYVVGGIISPVNDAYGKKDLISAKHRCKMVDLALHSSDWIRLDCWESDQETWQKTLNVLNHHQNSLDSITNANETDTPNLMNKKQKLDFENLNALNNQNGIVSNWDLSRPTKLMLLCGADLLESFGIPGLWLDDDIAEIVGKYGLVVITRQGTNPQQFIYESDILSKYQNNINLVTEWISNEISSTRIRRALRRSESVKYLLQDAVIQYVKEHSLYQSNKS